MLNRMCTQNRQLVRPLACRSLRRSSRRRMMGALSSRNSAGVRKSGSVLTSSCAAGPGEPRPGCVTTGRGSARQVTTHVSVVRMSVCSLA